MVRRLLARTSRRHRLRRLVRFRATSHSPRSCTLAQPALPPLRGHRFYAESFSDFAQHFAVGKTEPDQRVFTQVRMRRWTRAAKYSLESVGLPLGDEMLAITIKKAPKTVLHTRCTRSREPPAPFRHQVSGPHSCLHPRTPRARRRAGSASRRRFFASRTSCGTVRLPGTLDPWPSQTLSCTARTAQTLQ